VGLLFAVVFSAVFEIGGTPQLLVFAGARQSVAQSANGLSGVAKRVGGSVNAKTAFDRDQPSPARL
jgi:hypothetical protein